MKLDLLIYIVTPASCNWLTHLGYFLETECDTVFFFLLLRLSNHTRRTFNLPHYVTAVIPHPFHRWELHLSWYCYNILAIWDQIKWSIIGRDWKSHCKNCSYGALKEQRAVPLQFSAKERLCEIHGFTDVAESLCSTGCALKEHSNQG